MAKQEKKQELVAYDSKKITALDEAAKEIRELSQLDSSSPFKASLGMALAIDTMRELLTPEVMKYVMKLQGSKLGFLTDRDKKKSGDKWVQGDGYSLEVVKDVMIEALAVGANMHGNEVNIMSYGMYLTKNYFSRVLDEKLGRNNWSLNHDLPKIITKLETGKKGKQYTKVCGATVTTNIEWKDATGSHSQEISKAIKGGETSSADNYHGKADRKAGAWLLGMVTGERYDEGDIDDNTIDVTAEVIENDEVEEMAAKKDIEFLHELIKEPSIKDLDIAAEAGIELKEDNLTKDRARELYKELVKAIRKEGGKIPKIPSKVQETQKKATQKETEKETDLVKDEEEKEPDKSIDDIKREDLQDRIHSIGTDIHGDSWDPDAFAIGLYHEVETLEDLTLGQLTEGLKVMKEHAETTNV